MKVIKLVEEMIDNIDRIGISLAGNSGVETLARDKGIAELALFLSEVLRHKSIDNIIKKHCTDAIEKLLLACDLIHIQSIIYSCPQAALAFGTIALALQGIGREQHPIYELLNAAIGSPLLLSISRPEFREFEAVWLAARIQGRTIPDAFSAIPNTGILFRFTHASFLRREDMYAKTHMAMYMTDFGTYALSGSFDRAQLSRSIDHDLAWAFARADWDLVGELSMTSLYCLNEAPSPWQSICHQALDAIFAQFGCVPMPTYDGEYARTLKGEESRLYLIFHSYHTTIVYALLLLARTGRAERKSSTQDISTCDSLFLSALQSGDFTLTGSGLDSNWFESNRREEFHFRNDFVAEIILSTLCERRGVDKCLERAMSISDASDSAVLRETINVLSMHKRTFFARH